MRVYRSVIAALSVHRVFQPMPLSVEELRVFLGELTVSKSAVNNVTPAQGFIRDYLYNIDPVVAATFIKYEMREHLGFQPGAMFCSKIMNIKKE